MRRLPATLLLCIAAVVSTCSGLSCAGRTPPAPSLRYSLVDITLGGDVSFARAINNRGEVVGESRTKFGEIHAFLWKAGRMRDLGTLGGGVSRALAINDSGAIVGWAATRSTKPSISHAFVWTNGRMIDLWSGKSHSSFAVAINNLGVIGGTYTDKDGIQRGCYWDAQGTHQLGGQGTYGTEVKAIDDHGNIVGVAVLSPSRIGDACIWRQGRLTPLPVRSSTMSSVAMAISQRGVIVGWIEDTEGNKPGMWQLGELTSFQGRNLLRGKAFSLNDSGLTMFQALGVSGGGANSVNSQGIIVGTIDTGGESRAAAWVNGRLIDLRNAVAGAHNWTLEQATCINSKGHLVGWGTYSGKRRAFLLTPVR
jgi:probable HAF family extracellular repeat protein